MTRYLGLAILTAAVLGCDAAPERDPEVAAFDTVVLKNNAPFDPQGRYFLQHGILNNVPALATAVHEEFVQEFISKPSAGGGRMVYIPPSASPYWTELVRDSDAERPFAGSQSATIPFYDMVHETMRQPDGKIVAVRERIWKVDDRRLMCVNPENPVVYLIAPRSTHDMVKDSKEMTGKTAPKRALDEFETDALAKLRDGNDVVLRTSDEEMRVLGAIRARTECLSCHKVEVGTMLGAFTYTLHRAPQETPDADRLKDLAGLTAIEKSAVAQIEATGGKVIRDRGKPVNELHLTHMVVADVKTNTGGGLAHVQLRNPGLAVLEVFPDLQKLDVSYSLIDDEGLKEIAKLAKLKKLTMLGAPVTEAGIAKFKKALPDCEIVHHSTVMPAP